MTNYGTLETEGDALPMRLAVERCDYPISEVLLELKSNISTWAIVEQMGYKTHVGFVATELCGTSALLRIDTPAQPKRTWVLMKYRDNFPPGSKVTVAPVEPYTSYIGLWTVYSIKPCTEQIVHDLLAEIAYDDGEIASAEIPAHLLDGLVAAAAMRKEVDSPF